MAFTPMPITVKSRKKLTMKVTLWNSVGNEIGRAVKTIAMPSLKFDLSAFPSGMYFVVVQNQYGELVFRSPVIKQ